MQITKKDTKGDMLQDLTSFEFKSFFDNREIALSLKWMNYIPFILVEKSWDQCSVRPEAILV